MPVCEPYLKIYQINDDYKTWVEITQEAVDLIDDIQSLTTQATQNANNAANTALTAKAAADSAAANVGSELDKLLFIDEDENIKFIGKLRIVDERVALLCTQVSS